MKAILVVEMPDDVDISKVMIGGDGNIYFMRDGERGSIIGNIRNIKPMPKEFTVESLSEEKQGITKLVLNLATMKVFADGYNACLEEINK